MLWRQYLHVHPSKKKQHTPKTRTHQIWNLRLEICPYTIQYYTILYHTIIYILYYMTWARCADMFGYIVACLQLSRLKFGKCHGKT